MLIKQYISSAHSYCCWPAYFFVDSGAIRSAIQTSAFPANKLKMSGKHVYSVGASGQVVKEKLTIPLRYVTPQGQSVKHAFLLSELCPIN